MIRRRPSLRGALGRDCDERAPSNRFVNTEKYLYLAKRYLICGIFVQLTENKPLLSRYLFSYIKAVTTRIIESLQLFNPVLTDKQLRKIACEYMERMGYGEQPYIVFKHKNISREHPHIVSMRVDEQGRKLPHDFEARRSMEILRDLERKYGLQPSVKGQELTDREGLRKVNYPEGNVKQQISSVVRSCLRNYKCSSYGEFRTLLERFNVSVEERTGTVDGRNYAGIVYGALTGDGYGTSTLFKSSKIGKDVGYKALQTYYAKSKERLKEPGALDRLRRTVRDAMSPHNTREEFRRLLKAENIDTVFRVNPVGRIYGVTFIDHNDGIVANGSVLGKEFSARVFNELFPTSQKEEQHTVEPDREQQHKQRRSAASSLSGIVDTVLDLADTQAYEEQQQLIQRRKKRKLHR
mgnify:FL=1